MFIVCIDADGPARGRKNITNYIVIVVSIFTQDKYSFSLQVFHSYWLFYTYRMSINLCDGGDGGDSCATNGMHADLVL